MLNRSLILFFICSFGSSADHLIPEDSIFTGLHDREYQEILTNYFSQAFQNDVQARLIVVPSHQPEKALFISGGINHFKVTEIIPINQIWAVKKNNPHHKIKGITDSIGFDHCTKDLPNGVAEQLIEIWKLMLFDTKYPKEPLGGMDGTTYHFSIKGFWSAPGEPSKFHPEMSGKVWSPKPPTRTGKLVSLANNLSLYCQGKEKIEFVIHSITQLGNQ